MMRMKPYKESYFTERMRENKRDLLNVVERRSGVAAVAAPVVGVARHDLLRGQNGQPPEGQELVGLDLLGGGESPAAAALALVLHGRARTIIAPATQTVGSRM